MPAARSLPARIASACLALLVLRTAPVGAAESAAPTFTAEELARGQRLFVVHCARCHGMEGLGGFGPSLAQPVLRQAPNFAALLRVIDRGIPGTNMPDAWALSEREQRLVAGFVRSLGATAAATTLSGDPTRGREIFAGKAGCISCHTVRGQGATRGPDLTEVGMRRGPTHLRQAIVAPGQDNLVSKSGTYSPYLLVRVVTARGETFEGMRLNEDSFTLQLRDLDNRLHSFRKTELQEIKKTPGTSLMPSFAAVLTTAELDDVVAYLAGLRGEP